MTPQEELEVLGKDLALMVKELRSIHEDTPRGAEIRALWKSVQRQMAEAYEGHWQLLKDVGSSSLPAEPSRPTGIPIPAAMPQEPQRSDALTTSNYDDAGLPVLHPDFADSGSMDEAAAKFLNGLSKRSD